MFLLLVMVVTARVASPQTETLLSAYDTPSDLLRAVLGAAVCCFVAVQIFRYSRDPADMRMGPDRNSRGAAGAALRRGHLVGAASAGNHCAPAANTGAAAAPRITHSRQTGVEQPAGQPPPSAMNRAAVSERRVAWA